MKFYIRAAAIVIFGAMQVMATASVIPIEFTTTGIFSAASPAELTYTPTSFSGTVADGGSLALSDLGTFSLSIPADPAKFNGQTFTLHLDFTSPAGVVGSIDFPAALTGHVSENANGKLHINFTPNSQVVSFVNATASGSFTLGVSDIINLQKDGLATLTGSISNAIDPEAAAQAPEPGSMLLLGSALILFALVVRPKRARS